MNKSNPEISVIIPVYNVEKYLSQCIESIIKQSFKNIEIILVNDGSTDNSLKICEYYRKIDNRIIIVNKKNGGLSDARNYGLKHCHSEYVGFVDADDYIDKNFYERLYNYTTKNNLNICVAGIKHVSDKEEIVLIRNLKNNCIMEKRDALKELLISKNISNSVCNKIFRKSLFDDIKFPIGLFYEDEYVTYKLFNKCTTIGFLNETYYYYRYNPNSITHLSFSEKEFDRINASLLKIDFFNKNYPELEKYARQYLVYDCINCVIKMDKYDKKYDNILKNNIRENIICYLRGYNSNASKFFAILYCISPRITIFIKNRIKKRSTNE